MNTPNHLTIGNYLYSYLETHYGISLRKASCLYGCVCPDFRPRVVLKPHHVENYLFHLQQVVTQMSLQRRTNADLYSKRLSLRLGILCHYYSDFFCFAHNTHYTGTSAQHVSYEHKLHMYFKEHMDVLDTLELVPQDRTLTAISGIHRQIADLHQQYMQAEPNMELDMIYSIKACLQILFSVLNASLVSDPLNSSRPRTV